MSKPIIFLEIGRFPQVQSLVSGQKVSLDIEGTVLVSLLSSKTEGVSIQIDKIEIKNTNKLSTQEILTNNMNDRLASLEQKQTVVV